MRWTPKAPCARCWGSLSAVGGLLCFAAWRLLQALLDADQRGRDAKALMRRGVYGAAAVFYLGFAGVALSTMLGFDHSGSTDQIARGWTAWVLSKPFGQYSSGGWSLNKGSGASSQGWDDLAPWRGRSS